MDLRNIVTSAIKSFSEVISPTKNPGRCLHCLNVVRDPDDYFCSQRCSLRYWTEYRRKQGVLICGYPGCGKPCYVDAKHKETVFDFCGRTHAKEFKDLMKQMPPQGSSWPGNCGYPDCPKPRCIDRTPGVVHKFCGQRHATQYRELQTNGTVHDNSHQVPVVTRQASRTVGHFQHNAGPIYFYNRDEPYYEFTNFYERAISIDGKKWNTSEHYFQAHKFVGTPYMEIIRNMQRPRDAFDLLRKPSVSPWLRSDWENVKRDVMFKALLAKFSQHEDLKVLLLWTGNRELIEHTSNDSYWGDGGDGHGQNNLGKLLMRVREVLRWQVHSSSISSDGDDSENGGGPGYMIGDSGNGYKSDNGGLSDKCGGIGTTVMDSAADTELSWPEFDEELYPCHLEDQTDSSSDRNEAVWQKNENESFMHVDLLNTASVSHKNSNGVETGQMPEMPLSVRSNVDKAEPMDFLEGQNTDQHGRPLCDDVFN